MQELSLACILLTGFDLIIFARSFSVNLYNDVVKLSYVRNFHWVSSKTPFVTVDSDFWFCSYHDLSISLSFDIRVCYHNDLFVSLSFSILMINLYFVWRKFCFIRNPIFSGWRSAGYSMMGVK